MVLTHCERTRLAKAVIPPGSGTGTQYTYTHRTPQEVVGPLVRLDSNSYWEPSFFQTNWRGISLFNSGMYAQQA